MGSSFNLEVRPVAPDDSARVALVELARSILNQDRYLECDFPHALSSHLLGAFHDGRPVGFLRFLVQQPGAEFKKTPICIKGVPLLEAYVEAFGVEPELRRLGIGTALQSCAIGLARESGCYQIRSRSPISSWENYALKFSAGYVVHPASDNDSYFFILKI